MSKQTTAVEWLFNKLLLMNPNLLGFGDYLEQAKEMEKQQIIDAFDIWFKPSEFEDGEQYYNETFNQTT